MTDLKGLRGAAIVAGTFLITLVVLAVVAWLREPEPLSDGQIFRDVMATPSTIPCGLSDATLTIWEVDLAGHRIAMIPSSTEQAAILESSERGTFTVTEVRPEGTWGGRYAGVLAVGGEQIEFTSRRAAISCG